MTEAKTSAIAERICSGLLLRDIFDAMPEVFLYADEQGTVQAVNARFKAFFDVLPEEMIGKPLAAFAEKVAGCFTEFMSYHEIIGYPLHDAEHEFLRDVEIARPRHRFLQVSSSPVARDGKFAGRLWLMRDVTSEREITELKIQYGGVRGADELKSRFLTVISHQMRTPLNAVRWNMDLLLSGDVGGEMKPEVKEILQDVYRAVQNSISIADDMLLAVDIEQRTLRLERNEANLGDLLTKVLHDTDRSAKLKQLTVVMAPLPKDLPRLFIDADKVEKVLFRIIDNAIRYSKEGGSVWITVEVGKDEVLMKIKDDGIGIPEKEHARVFERFYRAKDAIGMNANASGLGLYISKFIVDAHDGKITFASREGQGTTFTIALPRRATVR